MGKSEDPEDGHAVAKTCYVAAVMYAVLVAFCSCQVSASRVATHIVVQNRVPAHSHAFCAVDTEPKSSPRGNSVVTRTAREV